MKPKKEPIKQTYYITGEVGWMKCPHCKKIILALPKEMKPAIKKWKKQK